MEKFFQLSLDMDPLTPVCMIFVWLLICLLLPLSCPDFIYLVTVVSAMNLCGLFFLVTCVALDGRGISVGITQLLKIEWKNWNTEVLVNCVSYTMNYSVFTGLFTGAFSPPRTKPQEAATQVTVCEIVIIVLHTVISYTAGGFYKEKLATQDLTCFAHHVYITFALVPGYFANMTFPYFVHLVYFITFFITGTMSCALPVYLLLMIVSDSAYRLRNYKRFVSLAMFCVGFLLQVFIFNKNSWSFAFKYSEMGAKLVQGVSLTCAFLLMSGVVFFYSYERLVVDLMFIGVPRSSWIWSFLVHVSYVLLTGAMILKLQASRVFDLLYAPILDNIYYGCMFFPLTCAIIIRSYKGLDTIRLFILNWPRRPYKFLVRRVLLHDKHGYLDENIPVTCGNHGCLSKNEHFICDGEREEAIAKVWEYLHQIMDIDYFDVEYEDDLPEKS